MKFLLVDKYDNIVATVELSDVGISGSKTYFKGTFYYKINEVKYEE